MLEIQIPGMIPIRFEISTKRPIVATSGRYFLGKFLNNTSLPH